MFDLYRSFIPARRDRPQLAIHPYSGKIGVVFDKAWLLSAKFAASFFTSVLLTGRHDLQIPFLQERHVPR